MNENSQSGSLSFVGSLFSFYKFAKFCEPQKSKFSIICAYSSELATRKLRGYEKNKYVTLPSQSEELSVSISFTTISKRTD